MPSDKILLEMLGNRFTGVVEEMGYIIHRAAFTVFVKETWDFDSALLTPEGEVFAYPRNIGVTNMLGFNMAHAIACFDKYEQGDVVLTNDPCFTKGMCTHLPDLMLFKPLFRKGKIFCFAWCFVHSTDVGGLVPGSIAPQAFDKHQEGVIVPPVKLFKHGKLDDEILRLILANSRIPAQNWGDLKALIAALSIAERRVGEIIDQYGEKAVRNVMYGLLDYGEHCAREVFSGLPDGNYEFSDYLEADNFSLVGERETYHVRIKLRIEIRGSDVLMDFEGTDPQVRAAFNIPTFGERNQFLVLGIVNFLRTSDRRMPFNRGILRPIKVAVPEGSLLNPDKTVSSGVRYTTAMRVSDVVLAALSQAAPKRVPAAGAGQLGIMTLSASSAESGNYIVQVLQPLQGGSGGRPTKDGIDGLSFTAGALRSPPTESIEAESPIIIRKFMLDDKVAPGEFRGGSGLVFECQVTSRHSMITSRGWDRFLLRPWGRKGGSPGYTGETLLRTREGTRKRIPKVDILKITTGEVLTIITPSGGGFGDPLRREPAKVLKDVDDGFVSAEEAAAAYGVILIDGAIDEAATKSWRAQLRAERLQGLREFVLGDERMAYEIRIPVRLQDRTYTALREFPVTSRLYLRDRVYDALNGTTARLSDAALDRKIADVLQADTEEIETWVDAEEIIAAE
jgi:N-methylhydantoinase B